MKKITIIFMSVLMIFASCSTDIPHEDINENTETVEEPKEDDAENNTEEPKEDDAENNTEEPKEEPKEDDAENDNDEEGNSENTETVEEPKEDDTENTEIVEDESSNEELKEDDFENEVVENKTWCEIGEDTKILGLNYFVCVDNSQIKLSPSINDENEAKKVSFFIRVYGDCVSKYIEIRVRYNNKKLNFSSVSDSYTITNVMKKDSTINITIEWK